MIKKALIISCNSRIVSIFTDFLLPLHMSIVICSDGESAIRLLATYHVGIVIIDSKLHAITGIELAVSIRKSGLLIPIIAIYDATISESNYHSETIGLGLRLRTTDSAEEWIRRTEAFMNQLEHLKNSSTESSQTKYGSFTIGDHSHCIYLRDQQLKLSDKEKKMLVYFLKNSGKTILPTEIKHSAWNTDYVSESALTVYISSIRKKIESDPKKPTFLKTVWGEGYIFHNDDK